MKISAFNNSLNNKNNIVFSGSENSTGYAERFTKVKKEYKNAVKTKADKTVFDNIYHELGEIEKAAKSNIKEKNIPKIFTSLVRWFGKTKIDKTGNKAIDTAAALTKVVLWGNFGKEVAGTILYTVQALTNEDLPKDKRKFVGMYDLAVGVVSTACSLVFGVGLEKKIKDGYKNLLKPLSESPNAAIRARGAAAIVGLAAFSSFALQTIVGKRIVAPAIATPVAGRLKNALQNKEAEKNGKKNPEEEMSSMPPEALILAKNPENKEKKSI